MNLSEIRQKYPQYEDMTDQQFADAFHAKYYPDMDAGEFYQKIGFSASQPETTSGGGVDLPMLPEWINTIVNKFPVNDQEVSQMVSNIPGSAKNLVTGLWDAATNPIDTAKGAYGLLSGVNQKMTPGFMRESLPQPINYKPVADAAIQGVKDRYGSIDAARDTAIQDPVGMGLDVATVGTGLFSLGAKAPSLLRNTPKNLLTDAVRMRPGVDPARKSRIIDTMLSEGIRPTPTGIEKAQSLVSSLNKKIDSLIDNAPKGKTFPIDTVLKYVDDVKKDFGGKKTYGARDTAVIDRIVDDFKYHMFKKKDGDYFTPKELQDFKKDLNRQINFDGKPLEIAEEATLNAQRLAAKEALESIDPNIKPTNLREGRILEALQEVPALSNKMSNYRTFGMDAALKTGVASNINPALTVPAAAAGVYGHPRFKTWLAYALENSLRKTDPLLSLSPASDKAFMGLLGVQAGNQ